MKKILVIGAHGQTGQQVIKSLEQSEMIPVAGVRRAEQIEEFQRHGVEARLVDVRKRVSDIATQLKEIDAIVFTAGGGMMIDLDGKVKAAQAAEKAGVKRFVLVSAGGIEHFHDENRLEWMNQYEEYSAAMYYGDMFVLNSNLDYTIIHPEQLTNEPAKGQISIGHNLPHNNITRADVANVVVASLENNQTIKQAFDIGDGTISINEALKELK
ncbi:SDR family oxidoreductase [Companilactobacillus formosensis]|uniref:SDR family oxidoreductase n=1 Tax=Companilactobacillus formosensis TaxID=1617889 RepID=UPI000E647183|nr:SDR family oxidoreductase [Companilactobacillus formosensis]